LSGEGGGVAKEETSSAHSQPEDELPLQKKEAVQPSDRKVRT